VDLAAYAKLRTPTWCARVAWRAADPAVHGGEVDGRIQVVDQLLGSRLPAHQAAR
jgi:hypothetical protein